MILAAGMGERMRPLTDTLPKPLLPVANRPVTCYVLEHLARHGFTDVIANLHYRGEDIIRYFGDGSDCGVRLTYTREEQLMGIAGGVRRCMDFFGEETFLVIGADDLTGMDLTALVQRHREVGAVASIGLVEVEETSQFGIVVTDAEGRIQRFVEKPKGPAPSNTANTQIYLFEPQVFDFIPPGQVYDFGFDAFPAMVAAGVPFYGFRLPGHWRDIGSTADYLAAQRDVLEGRIPARIAGEQVRPGVWLGEQCEISPEAQLTAPVVIGERCRVEAAAVGDGSAVGDGVHVPAGASLSDCVIWEGAAVPADGHFDHAVITPAGLVR